MRKSALYRVTAGLLDTVQRVISSPFWAFGVICITLCWMAFEKWFARHPIEGSFNGWAYTVLYYTLASLWVENFMKVQQAHQSKLQQDQMNRIEFLLRQQKKSYEATLRLLNEMEERDRVMHHLIVVVNRLAKELLDTVKHKEPECGTEQI